MAVNFRCSRARELPAGDPLRRAWVRWRDASTNDELWELNRGRRTLADRVDDERFATLPIDGRLQVVAEISGRHRCDDDDKVK
ncbi:hypothetical protein ACIBJE_19930 [Micromonospora sp. NPDC050187]|uniref:hypothetical protein n=1 Tax=Micromonospora sp. NPDC050187 TaxID=3364277 RepID=UPI0037AF1A23